ncbi:BCL2/adenovirus E1B 19 kDa protein-interacting protein 3-like isoform X1 [Branchiostoma floridae]|uniref:BCL2/adenovirus E1B 19 kDa protein-interacting protein 3-like isoform X1 n=1 Tax=Branchiostoma floridae TaxID=7739 RepID=A0A9J7MMA6_BRAFL|nr:BCL2/adenovirus E1B 19 kDa protein-interacting protein 3-like isoform X1 [Branchiostoma floridae]
MAETSRELSDDKSCLNVGIMEGSRRMSGAENEDSWVELHYANNGDQQQQQQQGTNGNLTSPHNGNMEKLLIEAQHESPRNSSRGSSSPRSPNSPPLPVNGSDHEMGSLNGSNGHSEKSQVHSETGSSNSASLPPLPERNTAEWIWDWSSRPEQNPPKDWEKKLKHPKHRLSMRHTKAMKSDAADFLTLYFKALVISHIAVLGIGIGIGIYLGHRHIGSSTF